MKLAKYHIKVGLVLALALFAGQAWGVTKTVCTTGCDQTTVSAAFSAYDLVGDDIIELRADAPGGTKTVAAIGAWGSDDGGSADHPVILQCRIGDTCIIDSAGAASYGLYTNSVSYITIKRFEARNATNRNFYVSGTSSNVKFENCSSSGTGKAIGSSGNNYITVDTFTADHNTIGAGSILEFLTGTDLVLSHITCRQTTTDATANCINATSSSNVTMTDIEATGSSRYGIDIENVATGTIQLTDIYAGVTRAGVAAGNLGNGVYLKNNDAAITITNIKSSNNGATGLVFDDCPNLLVTNTPPLYNILSSNLIDGFNTVNSCSGIVQYTLATLNGSTGHGIDQGAGDGFSSHTGDNISYRYCLSVLNKNTGMAHTDASTGSIYNCVLWGNGSPADNTMVRAGLYITTTANPGWTVKNCIIGQNYGGANQTGAELYTAATQYNILDYNIWYPLNNARFKTADGTNFTAWADWSANEAHSLNSDPLINTTTWKLSGNSPAIDAGTAIAGRHTESNTDVDIGAYEMPCIKSGLPGKPWSDYPPVTGTITGGDAAGNTKIYNCR